MQITSLVSECLLYFKESKLHDVTGAGLSKKDDGKLHPVEWLFIPQPRRERHTGIGGCLIA